MVLTNTWNEKSCRVVQIMINQTASIQNIMLVKKQKNSKGAS